MTTLAREYFDALYAASGDPWSFASSAYEAEKYERSLAALQPFYCRALELGCSIGVFTKLLAARCGRLTGIDISDIALERARARCSGAGNVDFIQGAFPHDAPAGPFDLVTCCEVGYYWSDADLAAARERIAATLEPGGDLLLVHFLPHVDDYVREGSEVHAAFLDDERYRHLRAYGAERYRLDLLRRR